MANLSNNRVNVTASDAQIKAVEAAIETILTNLPFLIGLTADERKSLTAIDVGNKVFAEDVISAAQNNTAMLPVYISIESMQTDMKLFNQLDRISVMIAQLSERIDDTKMLVGSEAFQTALSVYKSFGNAADSGVPGADTLVNELKKRFTTAKSAIAAVPVPDPPMH